MTNRKEKGSDMRIEMNIKNEIGTIDEKWGFWYDTAPDAVFMECGHGGIWYECAWTLIKLDNRCHFWRKDILSIFKLDLTDLAHDKFKVLTVTVIEEAAFDKSLLLVNQDEYEEESKGYYSEEESHSCSAQRKEFSNSDVKSKTLNYHQFPTNQSWEETEERKEDKLQQNLCGPEKKISLAGSGIHCDRIRKFTSIEQSFDEFEERKLIKKNISNRGFFLHSQRMNRTDSINNNLSDMPRYILTKRRETMDLNNFQRGNSFLSVKSIKQHAYADYNLNLGNKKKNRMSFRIYTAVIIYIRLINFVYSFLIPL